MQAWRPNKIEFILESTNQSRKNCIINQAIISVELPQISKLYTFYKCLNINAHALQSISSNVAADMIWTSVWGKLCFVISFATKKIQRILLICTLNSKRGPPDPSVSLGGFKHLKWRWFDEGLSTGKSGLASFCKA